MQYLCALRTASVISVVLFFFVFTTAYADDIREGDFPAISRLERTDTGFKQYMAEVETSRRRLFTRQNGENPETIAEALTIYRYTPLPDENIFMLAARCNIPYASLATLNRISHAIEINDAPSLLLPSTPGLFIPAESVSDLEKLTLAGRISRREEAAVLTINFGGKKEIFYFFPGEDFSPTERIFFLNTGFRFPLRNFRLTSPYGFRQNPVTGTFKVHEGLDLAAPEGTEVYAARDGIITEVGEDSVYGKYIVIKHGESWASLYGHLSSIDPAAAVLRSEVRSGNLIGRVGSTGQSTGPHLHFELRRDGRAQDPGKYLFERPEQR